MNDPRAQVLRSGYATVARAYREHLIDELAGKPLDRAFLDAFAERTRGGRIVDIGCGPGHVARLWMSMSIRRPNASHLACDEERSRGSVKARM